MKLCRAFLFCLIIILVVILMWQPSASFTALQQRAKILSNIRAFFASKNVLEVDVPVIGASSVTDPHLDSLALSINAKEYYLQTSPEFFMKRLLAAGYGDMYYLGKAFRQDESGRHHNPEFTMLEWYRLGFDDQQLMDDVIALVTLFKPSLIVEKITYGDIFMRCTGLNPYVASVAELRKCAKTHIDFQWDDDNKSTWLDLIFSHVVEPRMSSGLTVVYDYPREQAALAKTALNEAGNNVAKRFECFLQGIELANGYWELTDPIEQAKRFDSDNAMRKTMHKKEICADAKLLAALQQGMPECAGVALGVDRLVMALTDAEHLAAVQSFAWDVL